MISRRNFLATAAVASPTLAVLHTARANIGLSSRMKKSVSIV